MTVAHLLAAMGATRAASNPSGFAMPSSPPAGWQRVNEDDFLTDVAAGSFPASGGYSTRFAIANDGDSPTGSGGIGRYSWSAVSVHGSVLDVWLHAENNPVGVLKAFCAQIYPKLPGFGTGVNTNHYTYQRVTMCMKLPVALGYKAVPLFWNQSSNGEEIDFPECSLFIGAHFNSFNHTLSSGVQSMPSPPLFDTDWHVYTIEWTAATIKIYMDYVLLYTFTNCPDNPMRFVWQFEPNLTAEGIPWDPDVEGNILIDWMTMEIPA